MISDRERQEVIDALCDHFAGDRLGLEEFERRVDRASRAETRAELSSLVSDLPGGLSGPPDPSSGAGASGDPATGPGDAAPGSGTGLQRAPGGEGRPARRATGLPSVPSEQVRARGTEIAVWSGRVRKGGWTPPRRHNAVAFQGSIELDYREARFASGAYHLRVVAVMGGVEIIVPPDLHVECEGMAILGGFDHEAAPSPPRGPDDPVLHVGGFALLGGVDVEVRRRGESAKEARRRRRRGEPAGPVHDDPAGSDPRGGESHRYDEDEGERRR